MLCLKSILSPFAFCNFKKKKKIVTARNQTFGAQSRCHNELTNIVVLITKH